MARPKREPFTERELSQIETMAGLGLKAQDIAHVLGMSRANLYARLKEDGKLDAIKRGRKTGIAKVSQTLFQMATSGKVPAATFFYLKTIGGLRERDRVELTGKDGGAIETKGEIKLTIRDYTSGPRKS